MKETIINCPSDLVPMLKSYSTKKIEYFGIVCLDSGKRILSKKILAMGGESSAQISIKTLFWEACKKNASAIIVFHNHPSGNPQPSEIDMNTTAEIKKAGKILDINLLDHVIIGRYNYFSLLEHDLL